MILPIYVDLLATNVASNLQNEGYKVIPIPASHQFDDQRIYTIFPINWLLTWPGWAGLGW